ncbi:hypothetical protein BHE74_00003644 [Ensete ventricosum]|nr:hypothetical protein BHE74_00003644 [Ensete ventricosum]
MVDFDRRRLISGGISRGRKEKRKKKRENLEIQCCSPNLNPSPIGFSALRKENLWQSRGEETSPRILQNLSYSCFSKMSWPLICSADEEKNNRKSSMKYNSGTMQGLTYRSVLVYRVHLSTGMRDHTTKVVAVAPTNPKRRTLQALVARSFSRHESGSGFLSPELISLLDDSLRQNRDPDRSLPGQAHVSIDGSTGETNEREFQAIVSVEEGTYGE